MKKIYQILLILLLFPLMSKADDNSPKVVNDNTGGQTASITFVADVVRLLTIETDALVMNIGPLVVGETKTLGINYNAVFNLNGLPDAKFVINLIDDSYESNGVTLEGVNWEFRNSPNEDYTRIITFPFISQLDENSGDAWIRVYPDKIKANKYIASQTIFFEFKFNCSYYEF